MLGVVEGGEAGLREVLKDAAPCWRIVAMTVRMRSTNSKPARLSVPKLARR